MTDIHKAAGIIVRDKKLLVTRSRGKDFFIAPGGKLEEGETPQQAAVRELDEELQITVDEADLELFGEFRAEAAGQPGAEVFMTVFTVKAYEGALRASSEIEEIRWVDVKNKEKLVIGSIFAHEVIPQLAARGIII